jgi:hypothetical protein
VPDAAVPSLPDAVSAVLAAAVPGASFVDPLGAADSPDPGVARGQAGAPGPDGEADPPSVNGSEAAG